jgi:hypothetical protein
MMRPSLLIASLALSATGITFAQEYRPAIETVSLPSGTVLRARLDQRLSSAQAAPGQRFYATVETDTENTGLPAGTRVQGVVREARRATKDAPGTLDVNFTALELPSGRAYPIAGGLTSLDSKSVSRTESGRLVSKRSKSDRMKFIGYGAGAGALIGLLTGRNVLTDALLGAAGGYLYTQLRKDKANGGYKDVDLKEGAEFGVRLDRQFALTSLETGRLNQPYYVDPQPGASASRRDRTYDRSRAPLDLRNQSGIAVTVDGRAVSFGAARPMEVDNTVLVPMAPVMTAIGTRYSYNPLTREVRVNGSQGLVRGSVGSSIAEVDGREMQLDEPLRYTGGTLYVPDRFLELATGMSASWDDLGRTLRLTRRTQDLRNRDRRL